MLRYFSYVNYLSFLDMLARWQSYTLLFPKKFDFPIYFIINNIINYSLQNKQYY